MFHACPSSAAYRVMITMLSTNPEETKSGSAATTMPNTMSAMRSFMPPPPIALRVLEYRAVGVRSHSPSPHPRFAGRRRSGRASAAAQRSRRNAAPPPRSFRGATLRRRLLGGSCSRPEQALRAEQQHGDENQENPDLAERFPQPQAAHRFDHADDEPAGQRAGKAAHAAQHDDRERDQHETVADLGGHGIGRQEEGGRRAAG